MNHRYCKNCWLWKEYYPSSSWGKCYMHNSDEGKYTITNENGYCPDYFNHKKDKEHSLDDFIKLMETSI